MAEADFLQNSKIFVYTGNDNVFSTVIPIQEPTSFNF